MTRININKMSNEAKQAYLIDLIADLSQALKYSEGDNYYAELLESADNAVNDYHQAISI